MKWTDMIEVEPVDYTPPYPVNLSNPRCYLDIKSGGYYLGRVVLELKADVCPITSDNFRQLCEFKCYTGSMLKVWPALAIQSGDFSLRDPLVWNPEDPECFDFDELLPDVPPGGQSIFGAPFDDENFTLKHTSAGVLTMSNNGPNTNGSQFIITMTDHKKLDDKNVAFGQVLEGYEIINALTKVGKPHQDGEAFQRISLEGCGVLPSISNDTSASASMACSTSHASMHRSHCGPQATAHRSLQRLASLMRVSPPQPTAKSRLTATCQKRTVPPQHRRIQHRLLSATKPTLAPTAALHSFVGV